MRKEIMDAIAKNPNDAVDLRIGEVIKGDEFEDFMSQILIPCDDNFNPISSKKKIGPYSKNKNKMAKKSKRQNRRKK